MKVTNAFCDDHGGTWHRHATWQVDGLVGAASIDGAISVDQHTTTASPRRSISPTDASTPTRDTYTATHCQHCAGIEVVNLRISAISGPLRHYNEPPFARPPALVRSSFRGRVSDGKNSRGDQHECHRRDYRLAQWFPNPELASGDRRLAVEWRMRRAICH